MSQRTDPTAVGSQVFHTYPSPEPPTKRICMKSRGSSDRVTVLDMKSSILSAKSGLASTPISPPVSPDVPYKEIGRSSPVTSNLKDPVLFSDDTPQVESSIRLFSPQIAQHAVRETGSSPAHYSFGQPTSKSDVHFIPDSTEGPVFSASLHSRVGSLYNQGPIRLLAHLKKEWPSTLCTSHLPRPDLQPVIEAETRHDPNTRKSRVNGRFSMVIATKPTVSMSPKTMAPLQTTTKMTDQKSSRRRIEDVDFKSLPDYCPPISALTNPEALRVDWPGSPIDLSDDPNRHLLDRRELVLASKLRLSCATYLCSKRRIFIGRVASLETGKDFRKTDAQQACKIDVNKASKLWTAYENGGWFQRTLFDGEAGDH